MSLLREITVNKNEDDQRLDRFLKKYLDDAPSSFIYKMIRKKNIKLNGKRAKPEDPIYEGDLIQLYLAEDTIEKFQREKEEIRSNIIPRIIYEDENIILINKEVGLLSHGASGDFEENMVDSMISYLIQKEEYVPRIEKTFTPSICNRLDRNTSGIIIGAKNYEALKDINRAIRKGSIRRFYKTIVKGEVWEEFTDTAHLYKDEDKNLVSIKRFDTEGSKEIRTHVNPLAVRDGYSLLEIELLTGRTHQIRGHLGSLGYPVIGDRKYGDEYVNNRFSDEYDLNNQWLHGYKVQFNGLEELEYLNGKEFTSKVDGKIGDIEADLFK